MRLGHAAHLWDLISVYVHGLSWTSFNQGHFHSFLQSHVGAESLGYFKADKSPVVPLPRAQLRVQRRQIKARQVRIASPNTSAALCQFSISEMLLKRFPGLVYFREGWAGPGTSVTAVLDCFLELSIIKFWPLGKTVIIPPNLILVSSLCSLCSKATLIIKLTSGDDPRKILR